MTDNVLIRVPIRRLLAALLVGALSACAPGPSPSAPPPKNAPPLLNVASLDLARFMGKWYVIANIPYAMEEGALGSFVEFAPREDGAVGLTLSFHRGDFGSAYERREGTATITDKASNARWLADFGRGYRGDYVVIYVDPEYRYAAIGNPSRNFAWVLARDIYLSDADYAKLMIKLEESDYYSERLLRVPQRPEFMGVPGFQ